MWTHKTDSYIHMNNWGDKPIISSAKIQDRNKFRSAAYGRVQIIVVVHCFVTRTKLDSVSCKALEIMGHEMLYYHDVSKFSEMKHTR